MQIGIAAGEIQILIIGNDEERTYVEVGRGIEEVNKAENMCEKVNGENFSLDIIPPVASISRTLE